MGLLGTTDPTTEIVKVPATPFQYSAININDLEASDYTLVGFVSDVSGSVRDYKTDMEKALETAVESCVKSPRADNLVIRHTVFGDTVKVNHDWKLLRQIKPSDYQNCLKLQSLTSLFDGTIESIKVLGDFAERLTKAKYAVNGIVFIVTDGEDNNSSLDAVEVKKSIDQILHGEKIESLVTILIGVNTSHCSAALHKFAKDAGLTHYIELENATKEKLADLAAFISQSISSQSQALGTGGPSKQLTSNSLKI